MYPYGLKEDLIVRLGLNVSEKVILATGDTSAPYKLSEILLECEAIFDEPHATSISEINVYWNKVDSVHQGNINPLSNTL